jgi:membrane-bound serine protease (ClpP class)
MTEKVENDAVALVRSIATTRGRNVEWVEQAVRQSVNVPAREALDLKVVDLVAPDLPSLLAQIDGREVTLGDGRRVRLETRGVEIRAEEMTLAERLIHTISDPNIAYLLLTIGMYGLIYELANPGSWVPGTIGIVMLVLAFYALGTLETNWAGVALIGLAFVLFVADVVVTSGHGALTAAGLATLVLGSLFLFAGSRGDLQLSPWVIGGVALGTGGFFLFALRAVYRARHLPASVGGEALVGEIGTVMSDLAPIGTIEIVGELWRAEPAESDMVPIGQGQRVRVVARHGLTLRVHPLA